MVAADGSPARPLPPGTKKVEPKVAVATGVAGGVVALVLALCQLLYSRADLVAFLPDFWEPIVLALVAAGSVYGASYNARHQYRVRPGEARSPAGPISGTPYP